MTTTNKINLLILSALLLSACVQKPVREDRHVEVDGRYRLHLPSEYLAENDMHDFAPIQYVHETAPIYLVGFTESKKELRKLHLRFTLEDYTHFALRNLTTGLDYHRLNDTTAKEINGLPVQFSNLEAFSCRTGSQTDLAYKVAVYDADEYFCQLIAWAPAEEKDLLDREMGRIFHSFEDLGGTHPSDEDPNAMGSPAASGETE